MSEFVQLRTADAHPGVGTITLTRPPSNALTRQAYRELAAAAAEADARPDIAVVILYGGHEIFCAGDDVPELRTLSAEEAVGAAGVRAAGIAAVAGIGKPTVAALTGYALGAGLSLALAADWRVAGDNVRVGATEILADLTPDLTPDPAGLAALARTVGASRAKELAYSGRFVGAEEALALGLIDDMVAPDGVYEAALGWAGRFGAASPTVLAAVKAGIDAAFG